MDHGMKKKEEKEEEKKAYGKKKKDVKPIYIFFAR